MAEESLENSSEDSFFLQGVDTTNALLVRQTLRSGQNIQSKPSVVMMGDLNAGAEIVSEGDIIVLGAIRGMVHAGASGNRNALVFALRMQPTQIRIAEMITQPPAEDKNFTSFEPEVAFIEGQSIVLSSKDIKNFVSK
ncbi:MAG: septum site-determining protein MinC [SAR324 cluster bacterium]|nr:septum site-determining protein MinC [SAR324 cluster bacterium]